MKGLLLMLAAAVASPAVPEVTLPNPFFMAQETIPFIKCYGPEGGHTGSGIRISDDVVISASHVTNSQFQCFADGDKLATVRTEGDFAANKIELRETLRAVVSCDGIKDGRDYLATGYAFGGKLVIEKLTGTTRREGEFVRMNGRVYSGMSGGAVVDDKGRVVATISQKYNDVSQANVHPLSETYLCRKAGA